MATVTVSSHPDVSVGSWEDTVQEADLGCVEATRTGQTKPRWVAACFGPAMDASEGPFHAEFVPTDLPRSSEIMFGHGEMAFVENVQVYICSRLRLV